MITLTQPSNMATGIREATQGMSNTGIRHTVSIGMLDGIRGITGVEMFFLLS